MIFRLIFRWMGKLKSIVRRWNDREIRQISEAMIRCNDTLPIEIHRKVRSLKHIHFFKATEFRTIILYIGIVVFKDFLPKAEYELFLKLFCAVSICSSNRYASYLALARTLFIEFIEGHIEIYGLGSITSNIHNLSHVVDDVELFGELSEFNTYEFENSLHLMKLLLKQCNKPLEQLARRLHEIATATRLNLCQNSEKVSFPNLKDQFICPSEPNSLAYRKIEFKSNMLISNDIKNRWLMLNDKDQTVVKFDYAFKGENKYTFRGCPLDCAAKHNFFERPFNSMYLNIFLYDSIAIGESKNYDFTQVKSKLFCLPYKNKFVFMPLLHTLL